MKAGALAIVREAEAESVLIERVSVPVPIDERWNPLEYTTASEYVPPSWDGPHVGLRLIGAFKTLARMPLGGLGPTGHSGFWPTYHPDWGDLLAQWEADLSDLELQAHLANRVRIPPSAEEVSRMESVISWPARYLAYRPIILRTVQRVAWLRARDRETDAVAEQLNTTPQQLRIRNRAGLDEIAIGLRRDAVAVF